MEENNIVTELIKVDLHIHSASSVKDGKIVSENTIENMDKLIKGLKEQNIDMAAITDHNVFDYDMYKKLKSHEGEELKKVLPGIEFDVRFYGKRIHIITIFNDINDEKIKKIPGIVNDLNFDDGDCFKEKTFKDILKQIDLNVLLIAHQKSGVRAKNQNENLAQIGEKLFDEIIGIDYFDAVEFRSGKVEGILNDYKNEKNISNLKYITGTDCHVWSVYPQQKINDKTDIKYSYLKCLPTFKGLVMALTDSKRVTTSKYDIKKPYIEEIDINIKGQNNKISLSSGLNVIIGDNSIGKSLILESLMDPGYKGITETNKKKGYLKYLKDNKIKISPFPKEKVEKIEFDRQGEIRKKFQSGTKLLDVEFFNSKFKDLETTEYYNEIMEIVNNFLKVVKSNQEKKILENNLDFELSIPSEIEESTYRFRIIDDLDRSEISYEDIIKILKNMIKEINKLLKIDKFTDKKLINQIESKIEKLIYKYSNKEDIEKQKEKVKEIVKTICNEYENENKLSSETQENILISYKQNIIEARNRIIQKIKSDKRNENNFLDDYTDITINGKSNIIGEYNFLERTKCTDIDKKTMIKIISSPISRVSSLEQLRKIDEDSLKEKMKKIFKEDTSNYEENYKKAVSEYINKEILKKETVIIYKDSELSSGNSQGKNAMIYLDVLADEKTKKMYIVDQPGDDISHNKLSTQVIDIIKRMSMNKQVLFVTHKPELVVNLDVDNVIIIKETEEDGISIVNGALEYENKTKKINILRDVANILDGGEEIIRKRWKRYDK